MGVLKEHKAVIIIVAAMTGRCTTCKSRQLKKKNGIRLGKYDVESGESVRFGSDNSFKLPKHET